jgi:hypothetical protein
MEAAMSLGRRDLVSFGDGEYGLYVSGTRNRAFGTPLVARGPLDFLDRMNIEIKFNYGQPLCLVEVDDRIVPEDERLKPRRRGAP